MTSNPLTGLPAGNSARQRMLGVALLVCLALTVLRWAIQVMSDEPEVVLELGGTYEYLHEHSSASFTPLVRGHAWMGIPHADARLRFVDPQYGFVTPLARFFTVGFDDNVVKSIRMSPQIEPLLLDDALKVVLALQDQWREKGWVAMGLRNDPTISDTPEWQALLREGLREGRSFWQAGDKYQAMLLLARFEDYRNPDEERYLITLNLGRPWVPFDDDEYLPDQTTRATRIIPTTPKDPRHANPRLHDPAG